jgi:hypothetical protein
MPVMPNSISIISGVTSPSDCSEQSLNRKNLSIAPHLRASNGPRVLEVPSSAKAAERLHMTPLLPWGHFYFANTNVFKNIDSIFNKE